MKHRKKLGDRNTIGAKITRLRIEAKMKQRDLLAQLQSRGIDIPATSLSEIEGQNRKVTVEEMLAFAEIFHISQEELTSIE